MDSEYNQKLALLQRIVHDGIAKLLCEAKSKNYLEAPFGREAFPTPLITEDEFIDGGALQSDDTEPEFKFEYGFDPLKYLADFIVWSHPNSVEDRKQKKIAAANFLQQRSHHATRQMHVSHTLSELAQSERSGILWGPLCCPQTCTSVIVTCKSIKTGKVIIQISKFKDFREILEKKEVFVGFIGESSEPKLSEILPVKLNFQNLKPATKYFLRACLSSNPIIKVIIPKKPNDTSTKVEPEEDTEEECAGLLFKGLRGEEFAVSSFWTLPSEDRAAQEAIELEEPSAVSTDSHSGRKHHHHHHHHHHHKKTDASAEIAAGDGSDAYPPVLLNCFGQLPIEAFTGVTAPALTVPLPVRDLPLPRVDPYCPSVTCLLGDVLGAAADTTSDPDETRAEAENALLHKRYELLNNLSNVLARCPLFEGYQTPLHTSSFLLAWRDASAGSNYSLRAEELVYKQFRQEVRRHKKKYAKTKSGTSSNAATLHAAPPPTIARLPFTDSLQSLLLGLPIDPQLLADPVTEAPVAQGNSKAKPNAAAVAAAAAAAAQAAMENVKATRMMYRTIMLGPDVVIIVLDMRGQGTAGDYLGKEQAAWLDLVLQESVTIQWKVIMCGKTFGLISVPRVEAALSARTEPEEEAEVAEVVEGMDGLTTSGEDGEQEKPVQSTPLEGIAEDHEVDVPAPTRTVQLPHDEDKTHAAITAAMTEDVDDVYGRSACSLQHILAVHQGRLSQSDSYTAADTYAPSNGRLFLSAGIVLLTSGMASICPHLIATPAIHHHRSQQQDASVPAYVAGFVNLAAPSASKTGAVEDQLLPAGDQVPTRIPSQHFCVEVSLGRIGEGIAGAEQSASCSYFRDGFEASTIYSSIGQCAPSEAPASAICAVACCSLHLLGNGELSLKLYRADSARKDGTCRDPAPLFECIFEAPIPEDDEEEDLDD